MKLSKFLAASAALSLAAAPVVAQAAAAPLPARAGSEVSEAENLGGGGMLVPLLAALAVILGIIALTGGDDEDLPTSP